MNFDIFFWGGEGGGFQKNEYLYILVVTFSEQKMNIFRGMKIFRVTTKLAIFEVIYMLSRVFVKVNAQNGGILGYGWYFFLGGWTVDAGTEPM